MRQAALTVGNLSAWGWPSFLPSFLFYHTSPSVCLFLSVSLSLSISLSHIKCLLHFALLDIP